MTQTPGETSMSKPDNLSDKRNLKGYRYTSMIFYHFYKGLSDCIPGQSSSIKIGSTF